MQMPGLSGSLSRRALSCLLHSPTPRTLAYTVRSLCTIWFNSPWNIDTACGIDWLKIINNGVSSAFR